jgi:hypothetical protein
MDDLDASDTIWKLPRMLPRTWKGPVDGRSDVLDASRPSAPFRAKRKRGAFASSLDPDASVPMQGLAPSNGVGLPRLVQGGSLR